MREHQRRKFKMDQMIQQDEMIRKALNEGRPQDVDSKRLKRKVIYVYEDEPGQTNIQNLKQQPGDSRRLQNIGL